MRSSRRRSRQIADDVATILVQGVLVEFDTTGVQMGLHEAS